MTRTKIARLPRIAGGFVRSGSLLQITAYTTASGGINASLTWSSVLTRNYYIQKTTNLVSQLWTDSGLGVIPPAGFSITRTLPDTFDTNSFYRVEAFRPLAP